MFFFEIFQKLPFLGDVFSRKKKQWSIFGYGAILKSPTTKICNCIQIMKAHEILWRFLWYSKILKIMPNDHYVKWLICQTTSIPNGIMPNGVDPADVCSFFNRYIYVFWDEQQITSIFQNYSKCHARCSPHRYFQK